MVPLGAEVERNFLIVVELEEAFRSATCRAKFIPFELVTERLCGFNESANQGAQKTNGVMGILDRIREPREAATDPSFLGVAFAARPLLAVDVVEMSSRRRNCELFMVVKLNH